MPLAYLNKKQFHHIVVVIPGPNEPKSMAPYIQGCIEDLQKYGPPPPPPAGALCCACAQQLLVPSALHQPRWLLVLNLSPGRSLMHSMTVAAERACTLVLVSAHY